MYSRVLVGRTLECFLPGCGVLYSTFYPGVAYSKVRPTRVWRTLEYTQRLRKKCTLESKSCVDSVAAPTPASLCRRLRSGQFWSAAARPRSKRIGGGGSAAKNFFSKRPDKFFSVLKNFLMTFFSQRKN